MSIRHVFYENDVDDDADGRVNVDRSVIAVVRVMFVRRFKRYETISHVRRRRDTAGRNGGAITTAAATVIASGDRGAAVDQRHDGREAGGRLRFERLRSVREDARRLGRRDATNQRKASGRQ